MRGLAFILLILLSPSLNAMGFASGGRQQERLQNVLRLLEVQPKGQSLLAKARTEWGIHDASGWSSRIQWGGVSRTDTTLVRKYNLDTREEKRERRVEIVLRQDQSDQDAALDLAHELVHALSRPAFDPYDPYLTPGKYVAASIEGTGGEVEAMTSECQVTLEMNQGQSFMHFHRCKKYLNLEKGFVNQEKIREDFYRSGQWFDQVREELGEEKYRFPHLSNSKPEFYSSIEGVPYPIALIQEYKQLTLSACFNSAQRKKNLSRDQKPPSLTDSFHLEERCKKIEFH